MTFDRAWSRRAFASPAPFARALAPIWLETEVTFVRSTSTPTPGGGFTKNPAAAYLVAACHVEVEERQRPVATEEGVGLVQQRYWTIYLPATDPTTLVAIPAELQPQKGDVVQFTPDVGGPVKLPIRYVHSPETVHDHFQIETLEIQ